MAAVDVKERLIPILQKFAYEVETGNEVGEAPLELSAQLINDYG
jgi:hypothetical protein